MRKVQSDPTPHRSQVRDLNSFKFLFPLMCLPPPPPPACTNYMFLLLLLSHLLYTNYSSSFKCYTESLCQHAGSEGKMSSHDGPSDIYRIEFFGMCGDDLRA